MVDVNKLLQFEYLENLILQINKDISEKEKLFVDEYSFDMLCNMDLEYIDSVFNSYGVGYDNLLKLMGSDFLDDSWDYADLYFDDISSSSSLKKELEILALSEVSNLNDKIRLHIKEIAIEINALKKEINDLNIFIKTLNEDSLITDDDVEKIKDFIINCSLINDDDRFLFSVIVIKYLIENDKKILLKKELVDTEEFEKKLEEVRNTSVVDETNKFNTRISELPYGYLIDEYYKKYQELFSQYGYTDILEFIKDASESYKGIGENVKSIDKADFCEEIAGLLYQLNYYDDEEWIRDALTNLDALDELYLVNSQKDDFKTRMLEKIKKIKVSLEFDKLGIENDRNRLMNKIKMLQDELTNNIINDERAEEIEKEFEDLKILLDKMIEKAEMLVKISSSDLEIKTILNIPKIFDILGSETYNQLIDLQDKFLKMQKDITENVITNEIVSKLSTYIDTLSIINDKLNGALQENEKQVLKGFVLFDVSEDGKPYILTDLDSSHKDRLIDRAIEPEKLRKGYEDFNKLIRDLHVIGKTERLANNDSHSFNSDRLNEPVYWDVSNRSHENETGMYRIRYDRNGVERFVERKIVLHNGTRLYEQITGIIKEILPSVIFDETEDFSLYINFASAMKLDDKDSYNQAIKRYKRQSPLFKLFIDKRYNLKKIDSLTEEECNLLRDFINITLQTYAELADKNPSFNFDIIKQIGGKKTRG